MAGVRIPLGITLMTSVIGGTFVVTGIWSFFEQQRIASTWSAVEADLVNVRVYEYKRKQTTYYRTEGEFSYRADGEDRLVPYSFSSTSLLRSSAEREVEDHRRNRRRVIYYDPADPNRILLAISGFEFYVLPLVFTVVGAVVSAVALLLWKLMLRYQPIRCRQCDAKFEEGHQYCTACGKGLEYARKKKHLKNWIAPRRQQDPRSLIFVAAFFGLGGLALIGVGQYLATRQMEIRRLWPETQAEVVRSEITRLHDGRGRLSFRVKPTFRYQANETSYVSAVTSENIASTYASAEQQRRRYQPASRHQIRFNPQRPEDIRFEVEERGFMTASLAVTLFGAIFATIGLTCLFHWLRSNLRCTKCRQSLSKKWQHCSACGTCVR